MMAAPWIALAILLGMLVWSVAFAAEPDPAVPGPYRAYVHTAFDGFPPTPTATPSPTPVPIEYQGEAFAAYVTHYGESYNGQNMGCDGVYWSWDPYILAVSPSRYSEWPCGTVLEITGPGGTLVVARTDSCPGCGPNLLDLSEAGSERVCGFVGNCPVTVRVRR